MKSKPAKKRAVIIGANGLLGQKVVDAFAPHFRVIATGREDAPVRDLPNVEYIRLDLLDYRRVKDFFADIQPHFVVNCAAFTDVDGAEDNRKIARKVNATAVKKMVQVLRRVDSKFVQISTDYIFNGTNGPYRENSRPNPVNYYGQTKWEAENAIKASGIDYLIFRTNVLYGVADKVGQNFVLWVLQSLGDEKEIHVVDDQINNPTLANGLAEGILLGCVMNARGVYHYAGTELVSRYEFAYRIAEHFGLSTELIHPCTTAELQQTAPRPLQSGLITDKVVEELHIRLYDLCAGLKQVEKDLQKCEI